MCTRINQNLSPLQEFAPILLIDILKSFQKSQPKVKSSSKGNPINLIESENAYELSIEVPGYERSELEIKIEAKQFYIRGQKHGLQAFESSNEAENGQDVKGNHLLMERLESESFERWVNVPEDVDPGKAKASLKLGVLTVRLGKFLQPESDWTAIEIE